MGETMSDPNSITFKRLGERICTVCWNETGIAYHVLPDMEGFRALRRDVYECERCKMMSIGEAIPRSLDMFFDANPGDIPEQERISA
jgi:hypothetical protein